MNNSSIQAIAGGGVVFTGAEAVQLHAAISLKHALRLHSRGLKMSRGVTNRMLFDQATKYTKKSYKAKEFQTAIDDLEAWIESARATIPVVS